MWNPGRVTSGQKEWQGKEINRKRLGKGIYRGKLSRYCSTLGIKISRMLEWMRKYWRWWSTLISERSKERSHCSVSITGRITSNKKFRHVCIGLKTSRNEIQNGFLICKATNSPIAFLSRLRGQLVKSLGGLWDWTRCRFQRPLIINPRLAIS